MRLFTEAFTQGEKIPVQYTCDGDDARIPFSVEDIPQGAQALAFIMDDPDVPHTLRPDGMWTHWIAWNISPAQGKLSERIGTSGVEGFNTGGTKGYMGPCPPDKEHRYVARVYALDTELDLPEDSTKEALLQAMEGHILEVAELMGVYERVSS